MQKLHIRRKNSKYVLDENLDGHFRPRRKTANFCHPGPVVGVHHEENILKPEELLSCPIKISVHSRLLEEKNMAWLKGKSFGSNFYNFFPTYFVLLCLLQNYAERGYLRSRKSFHSEVQILDCRVSNR